MKVALVHDYLKEYGGAEKVLKVLHEMYPEAPIYTAFFNTNTAVAKAFSDAHIIPSWADFFLGIKNLHSPLRFLIPLIWESFDFSKFDVVILSSSGYVTKPIRIPKNVKVICYCHTPPRFIWGYQTSMEWQKYFWVVKLYGHVIGHFLRLYDFLGAKRVDQFIANSENIAKRIKKNYRRESSVVHPPIDVKEIIEYTKKIKTPRQDFYLWAGRIVGGKGLPLVMEAANKAGVKLKIAGESAGLMWEQKLIDAQKSDNIEFLGRVSDEELWKLYATCKAFIVAEKDVDFGIVQIEAMAAGAPVVAHKSGGYLETIVEGKTGTFFNEYSASSLAAALKKITKMVINKEDCQEQAEKFSKDKFISAIEKIVKDA